MRIFRNLRVALVPGSGMARYLRYALGEIVLVVVGILIALEVNNWNEKRIERAQVREYARALVGDLQADLDMVKPVLEQMKELNRTCERLAAYARDRPLEELDNLRLYLLSTNTGYRPYGWNRSALEQMKSAGAFRDMDNPELVKRISAYDALTHHLDEDFKHDVVLGTAASTLAGKVVDLNFPDDSVDLDILPDDAALDALRDKLRGTPFDRRLLTRNKNDVSQMVNAFMQLRSNVSVRHRFEVPKLQKMAGALIADLKAEYAL